MDNVKEDMDKRVSSIEKNEKIESRQPQLIGVR